MFSAHIPRCVKYIGNLENYCSIITIPLSQGGTSRCLVRRLGFSLQLLNLAFEFLVLAYLPFKKAGGHPRLFLHPFWREVVGICAFIWTIGKIPYFDPASLYYCTQAIVDFS